MINLDFLKNFLRYKPLTGAVVVKILVFLLPLFGLEPWTPEQETAVVNVIDAILIALVAWGVNMAREDTPPKTKGKE